MIKALILKLAYYITIRTLEHERDRLMAIRQNHRVSVLGIAGPSSFWEDDFTRCTEHIYKVVWHLESVCDHPTSRDLPQLQSIGQIPNHP